MRRIKETADFKRGKRRIERSGRHAKAMKDRFARAVIMLAYNRPLDYSYRDHELHGDMEGSRECHIKPDLLLVYRYEGDDVLWLEKIGSHSEIFGL
ncbi:MAG: type II toxin-antitoxin system YafQ family toxin [Synergistaceae bacterium]|nr:type II toxin-antitoxin system YafQ family toxin [Synergistaceae bacterium]